jgi:hypothetical protein
MARTKHQRKRSTRLLGGYVPNPVYHAIKIWVQGNPERDQSLFIREAVREKLIREGIPINDDLHIKMG